MWASPSKIPTKTSFILSGIVTKALSAEDKRVIPFVEYLRRVINFNSKLEVTLV